MHEIKAFPHYPKSDPRFYRSDRKKNLGRLLFFFVHFYGGHQRVLKRHITLVNELGYDAFAFNMPEFPGHMLSLFYQGRFGAKHLYARMLHYYLEQIPDKKIVFAFSNPCASAIEALADRGFEKHDVTALICDSGPSGAFLRSAWNLAVRVQKNPLLLSLFTGFWSWKWHRDISKQLKMFPTAYPILSIRGGKDHVIPSWHIDLVFKNQTHLNVKIANLQNAGHLDALKLFPEEYSQHLASFLEGV